MLPLLLWGLAAPLRCSWGCYVAASGQPPSRRAGGVGGSLCPFTPSSLIVLSSLCVLVL